MHRLHPVRDGVPVQRHRDARARRGARSQAAPQQGEASSASATATPRKAKLRRIASKCDHCAFYEDQACITACPTGALLEILPSDAVTQLPEQARASAKAGFDRTVAIDVNNLNESQAFAKGGLRDLPELGRARAPSAASCRCRCGGPSASAPSCWRAPRSRCGCGCRKYSMAFLMATLVEGIDPELALATRRLSARLRAGRRLRLHRHGAHDHRHALRLAPALQLHAQLWARCAAGSSGTCSPASSGRCSSSCTRWPSSTTGSRSASGA